MIRIDEQTGRGVALVHRLQRAVRRARPVPGQRSWRWPRRTATSRSTGATPLAVTDCLNFGSPEDPGVMWQFEQACTGWPTGCKELGIPVTGGNVSFYNQTGGTAILPTPVVGVLGVIDDVRQAHPDRLRRRDRRRCCCSARRATSSAARSGRTWCTATSAARRRRSTWPPSGGWPTCWRRRRATACVSAAHDLSDGGLAQAVVEAALIGQTGAGSCCPPTRTRSWRCSAESAGRALVAVPAPRRRGSPTLCTARGCRWRRIGVVDAESRRGGDRRRRRVRAAELREAWEGTLPALFD